MSIGSISTNPWANPYYTSAIGSAGTTTGAMSGPAWSAATAGTAGAGGVASGQMAGSVGNGGSSGLGQMIADVQSWLLQMQAAMNASASTGAASGASSGTTGAAGPTTETGTVSAAGGQHHGHRGEQGMALLRNIDQQLQTIESTLQSRGKAGAPQASAGTSAGAPA
jgi:hypothetical protein